jgi:ABC-type transporter Mla subunit MlaD
MTMEYATAKLAGGDMPDLGRLKAAAERVSNAASEVDGFLFRFRGPRGGEGQTASGVPQPPDTYRNDLDSLFDQLNRLETAIAQLREVG